MPDVWAIMRAIRGSNLPPTDRHILLTLVSLADPTTGVIPDRYMPSLTDLAGMTGLGRSTVARRMPLIEEAGWVEKSAPSKRAAWKDKETNSYTLLIPISTSPTERLVPERDQSQSGTSPGAGPELVPERDSTSPRAGLEVPNLFTNEPTSPTERFTETKPNNEANAGTILADFIDYCASKKVQLPKRIIGHYAKVIKESLDDRFNEKTIKNALAAMVADKVVNRPSLLPNRLVAVQTGPERFQQNRRNGNLGNTHVPYLDPEDQSVYDRPL